LEYAIVITWAREIRLIHTYAKTQGPQSQGQGYIATYIRKILITHVLNNTVWCKILMGENFDEWASGKF